jgi:UDP-glucose 4-epimerase
MKVLVTGGTGYIGSHTVVELINHKDEVIIIDNLVNSKKEVVDKIEQITGKKVTFYEEDVRNKEALRKIFKKHNIDLVIHFAGLKAVGESVEKPLEYYDNNLGSTITLLEVMKEFDCKKIIFSSSATVYGDPEELPITELCKVGGTTNPYGTTKLFIEQILEDVQKADYSWSVILLRYFNPIGADASGEIGESPNGIPNNLMPYINLVALGKQDHLTVHGNDYPTRDGTGVRDYIHVVDLALGHLKALEKARKECGTYIYNLGTGKGYSVLEMVQAFERVNGIKIKYEIGPRRTGDIAECYADPTKAKEELGWEATRDLDQMCSDGWNFAKKYL